jgi:hypothetical protein
MFPELRAVQIEVPGDVLEMREGSGEAPAYEAGARERIFRGHFVARTDFAAKCAKSNCLTPGVHSRTACFLGTEH